MQIVDELIEDLSSSKSLTDTLIKAKVLAHRLKLSELTEWINHELNGYPSAETIPDYRKLRCRIVGSVSDGYRRANNYPIPLPDEMREEMMTWRITQGITSLDQMHGDGGKFMHDLPPQMYGFLSESLANDFVVEYAKRETDVSQVQNVRTAVKSKLLDFLLKLSDETIEDEKQIPLKQMNEFKELFKNTVFGDNTTILVGTNNTQHVVNKKSVKGNFDVVRNELEKNGVDEASISELETLIASDTPDEAAKQPGKGVQGWMSKMFNKALDGSWKIAAGAAGKVLADVITHYYGW